jgi:hypothetical protein
MWRNLNLKRVNEYSSYKVAKPKSFADGGKFERFVEDYFFPRDFYDLVHKTHGYWANRDRFIESSKDPDFEFRDVRNERLFRVEAKYRDGFFIDKLRCAMKIRLNCMQNMTLKFARCLYALVFRDLRIDHNMYF